MEFNVVKFIENYPPYLKGEVARFPEQRADALIAQGYAITQEPALSGESASIKALRDAPQTRHIPGPQNTKAGADGPKCGICRKPGHTRANCPEKK